MSNISIYPKITDTENGKSVQMDAVLSAIKNGRWAEKVNEYRRLVESHGKDDEYAKASKKSLPYFTTSGTFSKRSEEGLLDHSGFIAVDLDSLADAASVRDMVGRDKYTYAAFLSCSGNGVCIIVKVYPENHVQAFEELEIYYLTNYGLNIDYLADVSRPRFISSDPSLILNPDSKIFEEEKPVQIGANPMWAETFKTTEEGLEMAHDWCSKHFTFTPGERHKFVYHFACICNRLGISETSVTSFVLSRYDHFRRNPSNAISQPYKALRGEHGVLAKYMRKREEIAIAEVKPEQVVKLLSERMADWSKPVPEPDSIISIQGEIISTAGNITVISGMSKTGKSAVGTGIMAGTFSKNEDSDTLGFDVMQNGSGKALIYIDTEQSRYNFDRNYRNVTKRAQENTSPDWFRGYWLKGLKPKTLIQYTWQICTFYAEKHAGIHMIFIDGIGDYVLSVNNEEASSEIVEEFGKLAEQFNCPLLTVLHQNYGSDKQRGHLGSQLRRKCESILTVSKNNETHESEISYPLLRNAGIVPKIHFKFDSDKGYHSFSRFEEVIQPDQSYINRKDQEIALQVFHHVKTLDQNRFLERFRVLKAISKSSAKKAMCRMERNGFLGRDLYGNLILNQAPF